MKKIRFYFWLVVAFIQKNAKLLIVSSLITFLIVIFAIYAFPFLSTFLLKKQVRIGLIKRYTLNNIPDEIANSISNPLVVVNQKGQIIPVLARSWEVFENGKRYRFHLRRDLLWSDGKKFIAKDLNYQFKNISFHVIDDYTIDFVLDSPLLIFPNYLTNPIVKFPLQGIAGRYFVSHYRTDGDRLAEVFLNPRQSNDLPKLYRFYDTEEKLVSAYKKAEINFFKTYNSSIAISFKNWRNSMVKRQVDYNQILTLFFNLNNLQLQNKDLRKAIAYLIPEFKDEGQKATSPIPPVSWAYNKNLKTYFYNEEKALSLFKKSETATKSAELNFFTYYDYLNIADRIKKNLEKLSIKINLKIVSYKPDNFDLLLISWTPPPDPDQYFFWHSTQKATNLTKFVNLKVDNLLEKGRQSLNVDERKKLYDEFQEIIIEELPAYFIYYPYVYTVERK